MRKATLAFLLGVLALYPFPDLPDARLGTAALPLLVASIRFHSLRVAAWFALGFAWALLRASWILAAGLPPALEGEPLVIEGTVAGLPRAYERALNFDMDVTAVTGMGREWPSPGRVRLSWYGRERILVPGETWRFAVKLKRPHGFMNPGGFDYEGWLFQHRIRALGHVIDSPRNRRLEAARGALVDRWRQRLALKLAAVARQSSQGNVLTALVIGTQDAIGAEQWQVFNRTGTSHLVSISGLHIGLIALLGFWVGRWLWSLPGFTVLYLAAPRVGALCGTLAALVYSGLAGFSVPTQRSFIMVAVLMYGLVVNRLFKTIDLWFIALILVLILDPFSVLAPGFWLSFGAVALILYGMGGRVAPSGLWWRIARLHVVVAIGLTPVLLLIFGQNPIVGPVANVLAVPWVSVVAAPLALAGTALCFVWEWAGIALLDLALKNLEGLWVYLQYLSELDYATWARTVPAPWIGGAALIGVLIVLAPRGIPARWLGLVWLLPLLVTPPPRPQPHRAYSIDKNILMLVKASRIVIDEFERFVGPRDQLFDMVRGEPCHTIVFIIMRILAIKVSVLSQFAAQKLLVEPELIVLPDRAGRYFALRGKYQDTTRFQRACDQSYALFHMLFPHVRIHGQQIDEIEEIFILVRSLFQDRNTNRAELRCGEFRAFLDDIANVDPRRRHSLVEDPDDAAVAAADLQAPLHVGPIASARLESLFKNIYKRYRPRVITLGVGLRGRPEHKIVVMHAT